jgi:hypothetical protein
LFAANPGDKLPACRRIPNEINGGRLRKALPTLLAVVAAPVLSFAWGHEGHEFVALIAEHYMTDAALARTNNLLGGATIDSVASWADDYRRDHPETGPWHYIDIPLPESKIGMAQMQCS